MFVLRICKRNPQSQCAAAATLCAKHSPASSCEAGLAAAQQHLGAGALVQRMRERLLELGAQLVPASRAWLKSSTSALSFLQDRGHLYYCEAMQMRHGSPMGDCEVLQDQGLQAMQAIKAS